MKVEDIEYLKSQIAEEEKSIEMTQQKVVSILSDLFQKDSTVYNLELSKDLKISLPGHLHSLFQDERERNSFWKEGEGEEKRRKLANERRAEYNAFLEQKERSFRPKPSPQPSPRSILESVDYDKVLAKLKQEEARFRNLNHAEPIVDKEAAKPPVDIQSPAKAQDKEIRQAQVAKVVPQEEKTQLPPTSKQPPSRTGGGGEPVKDAFGNLITARGFRESPVVGGVMGFPSFMQESPNNRSSAYRDELRKQIEEKQRLEAEEKRRRAEEEARLAARLEAQRAQMLKEYQSELHAQQHKAQQLQQDRLRQLEEFQRLDALRRAHQRAQKPPTPPQLSPMEPIIPPERPPSPPVPSVRSKVILERVVSPVATTTKVLQQVKPETVFSSLAEIRQSIMKDQHNKDFKDSYEVTNRRTVPDVLDDYDD